jgi:hypothetical protein
MTNARYTVQVEAWKPFKANTLIGFCTVCIPELHLIIIDMPVHQQPVGRRWANPPGRPIIGNDGVVRRDERGKVAYATTLQFTAPETRRRFSDRVVEKLIKFAPDAIDGS